MLCTLGFTQCFNFDHLGMGYRLHDLGGITATRVQFNSIPNHLHLPPYFTENLNFKAPSLYYIPQSFRYYNKNFGMTFSYKNNVLHVIESLFQMCNKAPS